MRAQVVAADEGSRRPLQDVVPDSPVEPELTGSHGGLIRDFLGAVRAGGSVETVASDNIRSLAMVHAAIESAERKAMVPVRA